MNDQLIGKPLSAVDTPALLLDGPAVQRNIRTLADFFSDRPARIRPHFKNHKCTSLMKEQVAAGQCIGTTAAKLGEAEVLVEAGLDHILIANQVIGPAKMRRLVDLSRRAEIIVALESEEGLRQLAEAAQADDVTLHAIIEVDSGMKRCGTAPGRPTVEFAQKIRQAPGVEFRGVMGYEGHAVGIKDPDERRAVTSEAATLLCDTVEQIRAADIPVEIVSAAGTGTYDVTGDWPGVTEVQCGSYVTMDWVYQQVRPEFELAMSVLVTVISRPKPGVAVLDGGIKTMAAEFGCPKVKGRPGDDIPSFLSEEHTNVQLGEDDLNVGDKIELLPSHCCTTSNLHRRFVVHDGTVVTDVWPIEGSGRLQ